jgi:hypothetical protein
MIVLNSKVWKDDSLHGRMARLKAEVQDGLTTHAVVVCGTMRQQTSQSGDTESLH